jgi:hypothetical protein
MRIGAQTYLCFNKLIKNGQIRPRDSAAQRDRSIKAAPVSDAAEPNQGAGDKNVMSVCDEY